MLWDGYANFPQIPEPRRQPQKSEPPYVVSYFFNERLSIAPKRKRLADDFVQLRLGFAAAEGERTGEMFPVVQRQAVKFVGDEDFQRRAFLHVAWIFKKLRGKLGQLLFLRRRKSTSSPDF